MIPRPATREELARELRATRARAGCFARVDLSCLNRVLEYTPEDMTVTVEAGLTFAALQDALARHGQRVPLDPPHAGRRTIRDVLDANLSGPRRYGFGTARDHLIGLRVALADGRLIHSGGKVVKNVAGYDLMKLFVGAHGSLGVIVEATFKLLPLPEAEQFIQRTCASLDEAERLLDAVWESDVNPVVLDLQRIEPSTSLASVQFVAGFAGTREEVAWQLEQAAGWGVTQTATLEYDARFHDPEAPAAWSVSVLPSRLIATLKELGPVSFVARAGNGVIDYRGGCAPPKPRIPVGLTKRIKDTFDPDRVFPELPL